MAEKPPLTPQDKKSRSYAKDRRNSYGENDKASRKAIPARKAGANREVRRKAHQSLRAVEKTDEDAAAVIESSLRHDVERVGGWVKSPDIPLREFLARQERFRTWRDPTPAHPSQTDSDDD